MKHYDWRNWVSLSTLSNYLHFCVHNILQKTWNVLFLIWLCLFAMVHGTVVLSLLPCLFSNGFFCLALWARWSEQELEFVIDKHAWQCMWLSSSLLYMLLHEFFMCMTKLSSYFKVSMKQKFFLLYCDVYPSKPASQTGNNLGRGLILSIEKWLDHLIVVFAVIARGSGKLFWFTDYKVTFFFSNYDVNG